MFQELWSCYLHASCDCYVIHLNADLTLLQDPSSDKIARCFYLTSLHKYNFDIADEKLKCTGN